MAKGLQANACLEHLEASFLLGLARPGQEEELATGKILGGWDSATKQADLIVVLVLIP